MSDQQSKSNQFKPYLFVLKEGAAIKKNSLDYTLMLLQIEPTALTASLGKKSPPPVYFKSRGVDLVPKTVEFCDEEVPFPSTIVTGSINE